MAIGTASIATLFYMKNRKTSAHALNAGRIVKGLAEGMFEIILTRQRERNDLEMALRATWLLEFG